MARYLIKWDVGYGECFDDCDAESQEAADDEAYRRWRDDVESNADFSSELMTQDIAENYGFDWEDE